MFLTVRREKSSNVLAVSSYVPRKLPPGPRQRNQRLPKPLFNQRPRSHNNQSRPTRLPPINPSRSNRLNLGRPPRVKVARTRCPPT